MGGLWGRGCVHLINASAPGLGVLQRACEHALNAASVNGFVHRAITAPFAPLNLDHYYGGWFDRYIRNFATTIVVDTSDENQPNIIPERILGYRAISGPQQRVYRLVTKHWR